MSADPHEPGKGSPSPTAARWLVALLLSHQDAERLLGDLDEEYARHQLPAARRRRARAWYWRQALGSVWALWVARLRRHSRRGSAATLRPDVIGHARTLVESVWTDLRFAARGLARTPTFTLPATLSLALGVGATTAIFSVVHAVLLRSLPFTEPDRIVRAWDNTRDGDITGFSFRVVEYAELRTRTRIFDAVGAEFPISATINVDDTPYQVAGRMVTPDFFTVFGVEPGRGRMFTSAEIAGGGALVCVVSHGFWTRFLRSDPAAVGSTLDVDGRSYTVLGVLPESYRHVSGTDAELFIPYTIGTNGWSGHWLDVYARLAPGIDHEQARTEIDDALRAVGDSDRRSDRWYATVESLHSMVVGDVRAPIWAVFGVVVVVLLLACVNVANLTLARSAARLGELGVRTSLGASAGRIVRQLLVESLVVALAGAAVGVLTAWSSLGALKRLAPASVPRIGDVDLDLAVLGFSLAMSVTTVLLFGLGPAIRSGRGASGLASPRGQRGETGGRSLHRLLGSLVVAEVALALTLLASAGLTVRTLRNLQGVDLGFDRSTALTFRVSVPASRYPQGVDTHALYARIREGLAGLPGVVAVGAGTDLPVSGEGAVATVISEQRVQAGGTEGVTVLQRRATRGFFAALGTPLLAGRDFDADDRNDGPAVAIVSASLASELFGGVEDAVGRRIGWGNVPEPGDWMKIVGVVGDVRYEDLERPPDPQIYQAHAQSSSRGMAVVVRTLGDPLELVEPARAVVHAIDPALPIYSVTTLGGLVELALSARRFTATLFGLFAAAALVIAVAGLYGVLSYSVGRRTRELGVRMALGADATHLTASVLGRGAKLLGIGLGFGTVAACASGLVMRRLLVNVEPFDPLSYGLAAAALAAAGVVACLVPARRAARADPRIIMKGWE